MASRHHTQVESQVQHEQTISDSYGEVAELAADRRCAKVDGGNSLKEVNTWFRKHMRLTFDVGASIRVNRVKFYQLA